MNAPSSSANPSATRLFRRHKVRHVQGLDDIWSLHVPETGSTIEPQAWREGRAFPYLTPGVWESLPGLATYRGQAVARRSFQLERAGSCRLVFGGVSHTARVFVDGTERGGHHNAYTPFVVDAGWLEPGEHEVLVHISNEHGALSALHVPNDYYNYGGITRPAELHQLRGAAEIKFVHWTARQEGGRWRASVRATIDQSGQEAVSVRLRLRVAGVEQVVPIRLEPGRSDHRMELDFNAQDVAVWSPERPALFELEATLLGDEEPLDDMIERVGFRTIATEGERLLLNGEPIFLVGFNRHEDHGIEGCALSLASHLRDLLMFRDLGANAVRTSHYPNDQRFLDLCDEMGFLVWEENHARGLVLDQMRHPRFRDQCRTCNEEMVDWHFNHPSIVMWGILNECASETEEGRGHYVEQFDQIRRLDPSRPTVFASCRHFKDLCQDLPDICGWNWYFGWYGNITVERGLIPAVAWLDKNGAGGKPMIASEFGAGGIPGYHDTVRRTKWSEERQADILKESLEVYLKHPRLCGVFIWQFCDVRVDEEGFGLVRPRCINDKGIVDEFRRPKLAYQTVRDMFRARLARGTTPAFP